MQTILTIIHLLLAIGLIALVLIQHGKGADAGAAFGSGASATVFGAQGSGNFLSRSTAILATAFFLTSIALAYYATQVGEPAGLMDALLPAADAPANDSALPFVAEPDSGAGSDAGEQDAGQNAIDDLPPAGPPTGAINGESESSDGAGDMPPVSMGDVGGGDMPASADAGDGTTGDDGGSESQSGATGSETKEQ
jgi:preprotein translocase subunit SecG